MVKLCCVGGTLLNEETQSFLNYCVKNPVIVIEDVKYIRRNGILCQSGNFSELIKAQLALLDQILF